MSVENFLKSINSKNKSKYDKTNDLFKIPKTDKINDIPHIKNNIKQLNYIHQADILYLPTSQFGYKYCLVVCDVSNSKLDAVALKHKQSNNIIKAFEKIYKKNKILQKPLIIQFDSGSEFKNSDVKQYLKNNDISYRYTKVNRHRQNSIVENANKRLGTLIIKFQAFKELKNKKKSTAWHLILHKFIEHLNSKVKKPSTIDIADDIAGNGENVEILELETPVRNILDYPISNVNKKRIDSKFRSGDVRWNDEIKYIKHIILNPNMPPMYLLNKSGNKNSIDGSVAYTKNQLQVVKN
jgi:transposase InsO family protein